MERQILATAAAFGLSLAVGTAAVAADLPKATQKALAELKLDASIMNGLDDELNVPRAWLDGAAKEDGAIILGTWRERQFLDITEAFKERYPTVKLSYHRAGTTARGIKVVIALREGRVIADVITSVADAYFHFKRLKALADLRELPGFKNLASDHVAKDGTWASFKLSYRCMGYNTNQVKKADLPKTWDDLLTNPRWRGGKLALSNHPNAWLLALWAAKGEKWGLDFTRRLFTEVDPQQRKEGMTANTALTVAGEFHANIPAPEWRAKTYADKGAPISYHCPEPVPITGSQIVMLEKAKNKNGARIFINWMLSREGQILQYAATASVPIHKALQQPRFIPFAETIIGKPSVLRDDEQLNSDLHKRMAKVWASYWTKEVGKGRKRGKKGKGKRKKKE
ncbi:MAG: extracellular solute-binding protein [Alphaproteobacteria bacterium]|nr:extracellular solute-binding protein [Alphaproteobacteria bacterium]